MMRKRLDLLLGLFLFPVMSFAAVPIEKCTDRPTMITTRYFGPYAFPVPDFLGGKIDSSISAEIGGDCVVGTVGGSSDKDYTYVPSFRLNLPLWSRRASLSVWGEFHEFYSDTPATRLERRVDASFPLKGNDSGGLWFSLDLLLLKETGKLPGIALRAATLTATGDKYEVARHYDAPGYFFDLSAGKGFNLGTDVGLRFGATLGFVCWQIDNGTQNDALLYGLETSLNTKIAVLKFQYGGYSGIEKCGDAPQSVKIRVDVPIQNFSPFLYFQRGIRDWPFTQFRIGLRYTLKPQQKLVSLQD